MEWWPAFQTLLSCYLETSLIRRLSHSVKNARDRPRSRDEPRTIAGDRVEAPKGTSQSQGEAVVIAASNAVLHLQ